MTSDVKLRYLFNMITLNIISFIAITIVGIHWIGSPIKGTCAGRNAHEYHDTDVPATQRAYHLEELKTNDKLQIDKEYYLAN